MLKEHCPDEAAALPCATERKAEAVVLRGRDAGQKQATTMTSSSCTGNCWPQPSKVSASKPIHWLTLGLSCAVEREAEAVAARERDVAQREASLQNDQEQLRQQQALLEETTQAVDKERLEARDMLKVSFTSLTNARFTNGSSEESRLTAVLDQQHLYFLPIEQHTKKWPT